MIYSNLVKTSLNVRTEGNLRPQIQVYVTANGNRQVYLDMDSNLRICGNILESVATNSNLWQMIVICNLWSHNNILNLYTQIVICYEKIE